MMIYLLGAPIQTHPLTQQLEEGVECGDGGEAGGKHAGIDGRKEQEAAPVVAQRLGRPAGPGMASCHGGSSRLNRGAGSSYCGGVPLAAQHSHTE